LKARVFKGRLEKVEKEKLKLLFNKLVETHAIAYQWNPPAEEARKAISNVKRCGTFIFLLGVV
jgi:hypothetical protein